MEILWKKWPQWIPISKIGHGSYGVVYKAKLASSDTDRFSAIKVISIPSNEAELYSIESEGYSGEQAREYFRKVAVAYISENEVLEQLRGELNVVSLDDFYMEEKESGAGYTIFIRMELLTPLTHWLRSNAVDEESAAKLGIDICTALEACEKHNIIHRDIKPDNILCDSEGVFKLGDFGIARNLQRLAGSLTRIGSENYIAPEIVYSKKYDKRVDIYSLGLVLYALLNERRLPFWPEGKEIITAGERHSAFLKRIKGEKIPPPKNSSAKLSKIILKACAFKPEDRYSSAEEMKRELEDFLSPAGRRKHDRRALKYVFAALLSLAMFAGAYFGISGLIPDRDEQIYANNLPADSIAADQNGASEYVIPDPAASNPVEPNPVEPEPVEPNPVEPEPVEPEPVEPEPTEPDPVEPEPVEPEPVEPDPVEPEPVEPEPVEPEPVEPEPVIPEPVEPEPADGIILNKTSATLASIGETLQLRASVLSGADMMLDWESSDCRIAAVDRRGLVTAVSGGTAIITAKTRDGSFSAGCAITVQSPDRLESKDYAYIVTNGKASVVAIDKAISGEVIIPSTLGGYPVVEIGDSAFYNCRNVTSVVIPEGVVYIGDDAFCFCYGLKSVSIPQSVTAVGSRVFWDCNKLETVYIPASVTDIGEVAFAACNSLTSINVDEGNTSYKSVDGVLYTKDGKTLIQYPRNKSGEIYNIPTDVTEIKKQAFWFCYDLTAVNVPASVATIGDGAFTGCRFLSEINVDEGNGAYSSADGVLYSKDGGVLIQYPCGNVNRSFEILPGVTSIYRSAFYDCENLRSIFIHKNVSHIGSNAFTRCDNLTIYSEAESQPQLWEKGWNYSDCPVVWGFRQEAEDPAEPEPIEPEPVEPEPVEPEPVEPEPVEPEPVEPEPEPVEPEPVEPEPVEPEPVEPEPEPTPELKYLTYSISNGQATVTGFNKSYAGTVTIPSTLGGNPVTGIGDEAFMGCTEITDVTVPDSVTNIGASAFRGCKKLADPDGFVIVKDVLFDYYGEGGTVCIPNGITTVSDAAFINNPKVIEIVIPDTVTEIGSSAFFGSAVTKINIPGGVTSIAEAAFAYCGGLESIVIPDGVVSIGTRAFYDCFSLIDISIPDSVVSIGSAAFYSCNQLTNIILPNRLTAVEVDTFNGCSNLKSMTIPDSVVRIGNYAFSGCSRLNDVTVGSGVDSIGIYAFDKCRELTGIILPIGVESIGVNAFNACTQLTIYAEAASKPDGWIDYWNPDSRPVVWGYGTQAEDTSAYTYNISDSRAVITAVDTSVSGDITIPATLGGCPVVSIGDRAFFNCDGITSVTIPESVTEIGQEAFYSCDSLTGVTVPEGIGAIGSGVFYGCSSLTSVNIPNSVTRIGSYAFCGCSALTSIHIPDGVTAIGDGAFDSCSSLVSITVPESVTALGEWLFTDCTKLESIVAADGNSVYKSVDGVLYDKSGTTLVRYPEGKTNSSYAVLTGVTSIGQRAFYNCDRLTSITIPEGVDTIGSDAFAHSDNLADVNIPESVATIGEYAFEHCSALTSVVIPSGVTTVGSYAFGSCSSLTIYAEAASQPEGWSNEWNIYGCPVEWGYGSAEE